MFYTSFNKNAVTNMAFHAPQQSLTSNADCWSEPDDGNPDINMPRPPTGRETHHFHLR